MGHVSYDIWYVTCDMWHMTNDIGHMTHNRLLTFCQSLRSLALTVWELWCFEYLEEKDDWLTESINDGGVCKIVPAMPGLLNKLFLPHLTIPTILLIIMYV